MTIPERWSSTTKLGLPFGLGIKTPRYKSGLFCYTRLSYMKKWLPLVIFFLILLGGIWFWSIGALPDEDRALARVTEVTGTASVKTGDTVESGTIITTGPESSVILSWFESGETRLGADTELRIDTASSGAGESMVIKLKLETGRVWSRILRLLDVEGDMTIETNDVVATVRGTAFDLEVKQGEPTTLWVSDSVVQAAAKQSSGAPLFVAEGSMAKFTSGKRATSTEPITASGKASDWFKDNQERDVKFVEEARRRMREKIGLDRVPSTGWLRDAIRASEGLRAPNARYLVRRIAQIRRVIEEGKSGLAFQEFSRLETEWRSRMSDGADPSELRVARQALILSERLYEDVAPDHPAYRIKQSLEDWRVTIAVGPAEKIYARLLAIDARLDEARHFLMKGDAPSSIISIELADNTLENINREYQQSVKELDKEKAEKLKSKLDALSARSKALRAETVARESGLIGSDNLDPLDPPDAITVSSTTATATVPVIEVPTSTPPTPAPPTQDEQLVPVSLTIDPVQSMLGFSQSAVYRAIVVYKNGLSKDVTKTARFTANPTGYGALNGNVFRAMELKGDITINASYTEGGIEVNAQAFVSIVDNP